MCVCACVCVCVCARACVTGWATVACRSRRASSDSDSRTTSPTDGTPPLPSLRPSRRHRRPSGIACGEIARFRWREVKSGEAARLRGCRSRERPVEDRADIADAIQPQWCAFLPQPPDLLDGRVPARHLPPACTPGTLSPAALRVLAPRRRGNCVLVRRDVRLETYEAVHAPPRQCCKGRCRAAAKRRLVSCG